MCSRSAQLQEVHAPLRYRFLRALEGIMCTTDHGPGNGDKNGFVNTSVAHSFQGVVKPRNRVDHHAYLIQGFRIVCPNSLY
jgi:hypothetical protein